MGCVKLAMLWAAAQGTWRSGARWLTLGMPLLVALVAASLLPVRRCAARAMLAAAAAWMFQWHRLCSPLGLALAMQAVTWAAVELAMMLWAAAQETWRIAVVAASSSLLSARRCDARSRLADAGAWMFQWHRRCALLWLALAKQAVTRAAVKLAMLRAAAQGTWRSGARWLTLGTPLLATPPCLHVHVACL